MSYAIGNAVKAEVAYSNGAGQLADPSVIQATVTQPNGSSTTYTYGVNAELVRDSLGQYHVTVTFTTVGTWTVVHTGIGAVAAAVTLTYQVGGGTTAQALIQATKRQMYSGYRENRNQLAGAASVNTASLTFTYDMAGIVPGVYLSIDLEIFYVWAVDASNKSATVTGGQQGSSPAAHSTGAVVAINPQFSDFAILSAINDDLDDLCSPQNGLFQVKTIDRNWDAILSGYDFAADAIGDPLEIRYKTFATNNFQPLIRDFDVARNLPTSDFPSGMAVFVYAGGNQGLPLHIRYRAPFAHLSALTDDVQAVTGLPATANDLPPLGAAVALMAPREIKRNFTEAQSDSRRSEEVPPGAVANSSRGIIQRRQERVAAEAARLEAQWPTYVGER